MDGGASIVMLVWTDGILRISDGDAMELQLHKDRRVSLRQKASHLYTFTVDAPEEDNDLYLIGLSRPLKHASLTKS